MARLTNKDTGEVITSFVSLKAGQEVIRVLHQTLDGARHIQRIGAPAVSYALTLYVTGQGKELLMRAEDTAALLEAAVKSGVYYGRITELGDFERLPAGYFKVSATLAKETEG